MNTSQNLSTDSSAAAQAQNPPSEPLDPRNATNPSAENEEDVLEWGPDATDIPVEKPNPGKSFQDKS